MGYRKKTLRKLPETSRKLARLLNELDSTLRKARNLLPEIVSLEHDSIALYRASQIISPAKDTKPRTPPTAPTIPLFEEPETTAITAEPADHSPDLKRSRRQKTKPPATTAEENHGN